MGKMNFGFKLPVIFLREKKRFSAYSPALDLSTSGKTFKEAQKRFGKATIIFFKEIIREKTINEVLEELGWHKIKKEWKPPIIISQQPEMIKVPFNV